MHSANASAIDYGRPVARPVAKGARPQFRPSRGVGANAHRHAPLKLLAATRGDGALVQSSGSARVAYELDIFSDGRKASASGSLCGDFDGLLSPDLERQSAWLRLQDGREIRIDMFDLEPGLAGFEAEADLTAHARAAGWRAAAPI